MAATTVTIPEPTKAAPKMRCVLRQSCGSSSRRLLRSPAHVVPPLCRDTGRLPQFTRATVFLSKGNAREPVTVHATDRRIGTMLDSTNPCFA
jgi:hypothetical protein